MSGDRTKSKGAPPKKAVTEQGENRAQTSHPCWFHPLEPSVRQALQAVSGSSQKGIVHLEGLSSKPGPRSFFMVRATVILLWLLAGSLGGCGRTGAIRHPRLTVPRAKKARWLGSGPQSHITPTIRALALRLRGPSPLSTLSNIHRWVRANTRPYKGSRSAVLRQRTADELLSDKTLSGCGDWGVLLAALFRAAGIPTIYVEAVDWHWARRWVDGSDMGPHLGHVFLEVYFDKTWHLVDSTRGWIWSHYDPDEPSLPLHHYAFAKGLDAWDLGLKSFAALRRSLENIAEYLDNVKIRPVSYPRRFLTPTVLLLADAATVDQRRSIHRSVYFKHRSTRALSRGQASPELEGLDTLVSVVSGKPKAEALAKFLGLPHQAMIRIRDFVSACRGRHRCRRALYLETGNRRICVAVTASHKALVPFLHGMLQVAPGDEHALSKNSCSVRIVSSRQVDKAEPRKAMRPSASSTTSRPARTTKGITRAARPARSPASRRRPPTPAHEHR